MSDTSNVTNLTALKDNSKRVEILTIIEAMMNAIQDADTVSDLTVLVKIDGDFVRYASSTEDVMSVVAQLELAKFDALRRMMQ